MGGASHVGLMLDFGTGEYAADNMTKGQFRALDTALAGGIRAPAGPRQARGQIVVCGRARAASARR